MMPCFISEINHFNAVLHHGQEYAENRSITSVVPVDNPLTTDEPELLEMSPEQAEETQLCASRLTACHY